MKKISIHIGLPKTATTYIQKTLSSQNSYLGFPEFPFVSPSSSQDRLIIAEFLKFMSEVLSKEVMIGAVLTIRNQPEWLASKYAQASPCLFNAGQSDFEKRIKYFASSGNDLWCNWGRIVSEIDAAIGKNNVLVVCMEDIDKDFFWNDISDFSGQALL